MFDCEYFSPSFYSSLITRAYKNSFLYTLARARTIQVPSHICTCLNVIYLILRLIAQFREASCLTCRCQLRETKLMTSGQATGRSATLVPYVSVSNTQLHADTEV